MIFLEEIISTDYFCACIFCVYIIYSIVFSGESVTIYSSEKVYYMLKNVIIVF